MSSGSSIFSAFPLKFMREQDADASLSDAPSDPTEDGDASRPAPPDPPAGAAPQSEEPGVEEFNGDFGFLPPPAGAAPQSEEPEVEECNGDFGFLPPPDDDEAAFSFSWSGCPVPDPDFLCESFVEEREPRSLHADDPLYDRGRRCGADPESDLPFEKSSKKSEP